MQKRTHKRAFLFCSALRQSPPNPSATQTRRRTKAPVPPQKNANRSKRKARDPVRQLPLCRHTQTPADGHADAGRQMPRRGRSGTPTRTVRSANVYKQTPRRGRSGTPTRGSASVAEGRHMPRSTTAARHVADARSLSRAHTRSAYAELDNVTDDITAIIFRIVD